MAILLNQFVTTTSLIAAAILFLALSVTRQASARCFVLRSLYVLLPWCLISLVWFASLSERGFLHPSQFLLMSALLILIAELLGLAVSTLVSRT